MKKCKKFHNNYPQVIAKLKHKQKIKVSFFLIHASVWKYDELFKLMLADERFEPLIVICPYVVMGEQVMLRDLCITEKFVSAKRYPYITTYDKVRNSWVDVKMNICPDVIFFTNPYDKLTRDEYYIENFDNTLNFFVPYSSTICSVGEFGFPLQDMVYHYFLENQVTASIAKELMITKARNVEVVGYPSLDAYFRKDYIPVNVWKHHQACRIIWAPHHTIQQNNDNLIKFSNFFEYAEQMILLSKKYAEKVQFSFKPHPLLRPKLEIVWGVDKTSEYYNYWDESSNTQYDYSEYVDLFATSDAMIFDSCSFVNEYIYTKKPSLFLYNQYMDEQLNDFGRAAMNCHQRGYSVQDIETFILDRINKLSDPLKEQKEDHFNNYLIPPNGVTASQNILDILKNIVSSI